MGKYIVDTDVVDQAVKELKSLQEECLEYYNIAMPESSYDMGNTHNEIIELYENLRNTWSKFDELISKSIEFLGKDSETVITADKEAADALKEETTVNTQSSYSKSSRSGGSFGSGGGGRW